MSVIRFIAFHARVCILWLACIILVSCKPGPPASNEGMSLQQDSLYPAVLCENDSMNSYALYLPPAYQEKTKWPLIIFLDPHANGLLPVNLFREEAAKQGFILAGSNSSKNGMSMKESLDCCKTLIHDLKARLNIDPGAIYLSGFSGGSRVAGAFALSEGGIAGVIGCGAGMQPKPGLSFSYLAVTGNEDFNYLEMNQLDQEMEKAGMVHHLLVFDGPHQWPPEKHISFIFNWIQFDRMRNGNLPTDRIAINAFIDHNYTLAETFSKNNQHYERYLALTMMAHFLDGLTDVTPLDQEASILRNQAAVADFIEYSLLLTDKERALGSTYSKELQEEPFPAFEHNVKQLIKKAQFTPATNESRMYKRVLAYLSMNAYSLSNAALRQGNLALADEFVRKYACVDPGNPEHRYLAATISLKSGRPQQALKDIEQARDLGFKDIKRLKEDPSFQELNNYPEFQSVLKALTP